MVLNFNSNSTHLVIEDRTDGRNRSEIPSEERSLSAWKIQSSGLLHSDRDDLIRLRVQAERQ